MRQNNERKRKGRSFFIAVVKLCLAIAVARGLFSAYYGSGGGFAEALVIATIIAPILGGAAYLVGYASGSVDAPVNQSATQASTDEGLTQDSLVATTTRDDGEQAQSPYREPMSGDMKGILWVIGLSALTICGLVLYQEVNKTRSALLSPANPTIGVVEEDALSASPAGGLDVSSPVTPASIGPIPESSVASPSPGADGLADDTVASRIVPESELTERAIEAASTPVTIRGTAGYGCGGSTGTACFLLINDQATYVIATLFEASDGLTEKMNAAIQSGSCLAVTGSISKDKMGVFYTFDERHEVQVNDCDLAQNSSQDTPIEDWFEVGKTSDAAIRLKASTFRRNGQGTADSAACILGQMLTARGSLLNQYCVHERECIAGFGALYIQEVDFRPSSSASFALGGKGGSSAIAEFLCKAMDATG